MTHKVENTVFGQCKFECVYCLDFIQSLPILHHVGICTAANSTYASPSSILFISVATQATAAPSKAHKAARWHLDIFLLFIYILAVYYLIQMWKTVHSFYSEYIFHTNTQRWFEQWKLQETEMGGDKMSTD